MRFRNAVWILLVSLPAAGWGNSYNLLMKRYEDQLSKQESRLKAMRKEMMKNEQEAEAWVHKAAKSKNFWKQSQRSLENATRQLQEARAERSEARTEVEASLLTVEEKSYFRDQSTVQVENLVNAAYRRQTADRRRHPQQPAYSMALLGKLTHFAEWAREEADVASERANALKLKESKLLNKEQAYFEKEQDYRSKSRSYFDRWQRALARRKELQDENAQLEQSAKALKVMIAEIRRQRDDARLSESGSLTPGQLASLKGTLPWPVLGKVSQRFGRQQGSDLHHLLVSNGIKISAGAGRPVRVVETGKVLYARPFRSYGNLVIVQHTNGLTSVYGSLGETLVKEGDTMAALDVVGTLGTEGSFYFELRHNEKPINPLVFLSNPKNQSEISSRRTYE